MTLSQMARACGRNALVLKEFKIADEGPCFVRIVGRKSGLFNWIKALFGLEDVTRFEVFEDRIEYSDSSRSGSFKEAIPLSSVSNLGTGYLRPFMVFLRVIVFAAIAVYLQVAALQYGDVARYASILCFVLAAVSLFRYVFGKTLVMYFIPSSGEGTTMSFKRSLIEGVSVGPDEARAAIKVVSDLVRRNTGGR